MTEEYHSPFIDGYTTLEQRRLIRKCLKDLRALKYACRYQKGDHIPLAVIAHMCVMAEFTDMKAPGATVETPVGTYHSLCKTKYLDNIDYHKKAEACNYSYELDDLKSSANKAWFALDAMRLIAKAYPKYKSLDNELYELCISRCTDSRNYKKTLTSCLAKATDGRLRSVSAVFLRELIHDVIKRADNVEKAKDGYGYWARSYRRSFIGELKRLRNIIETQYVTQLLDEEEEEYE